MAISLSFKLVLIVGMVITGAANTIFLGLQIQANAYGIEREKYGKHNFNHPFVQTLFMFGGELLCLAAFYILSLVGGLFGSRQRLEESRSNDVEKPLLDEEEVTVEDESQKKMCFNPFVLFPPAMCDLVGSTLSGIALLYLAPPLWQMMRASIIVFTGLLSLIFLRRRLNLYNYAGMAIVCLGLLCVAGSGLGEQLTTEGGTGFGGSAKNYLIGITFVLTGMFMNAVQFVLEEVALKKRSYPPLQVVGWEGFWGLLFTVIALVPIGYFVPSPDNKTGDDALYYGGRYDNAYDALLQMKNNYWIIVLGLCGSFSIAFYNFFGVSVTKHVSSLARALIDCLRTILIWIFMTGFYYLNKELNIFDHTKGVGTPWTNWNFLQLVGFVLLVAGNIVYDLESIMGRRGNQAAEE